MESNTGAMPGDYAELLKSKLSELRRRREKRSQLVRIYAAMGAILMVVSPFLYLTLPQRNRLFLSTGAIVYSALLLALSFAISPREIKEEILRGEDELELLSIEDTSREQRAQKLLKLHQAELKRYYDQTLRQTSVIFFTGLICIFLGFGVVGGSLFVIWRSPADDVTQKFILAGLGAVGGVLSNFVAVMYLRMFTQTVSSLAEFHNRLVSTHNLYFGNFLMSKVRRESEIYEKVLSEIAVEVTSAGLPTPGRAEKTESKEDHTHEHAGVSSKHEAM